MAPSGSWTSAPKEAFIVGLKELPESDDPVTHRHIFYAHAYKVSCQFIYIEVDSDRHNRCLDWNILFLAYGYLLSMTGSNIYIYVPMMQTCKQCDIPSTFLQAVSLADNVPVPWGYSLGRGIPLLTLKPLPYT